MKAGIGDIEPLVTAEQKDKLIGMVKGLYKASCDVLIDEHKVASYFVLKKITNDSTLLCLSH